MADTRFTGLGLSGSGKTCYVLGMYYEMCVGLRGFTLTTTNQTASKLENWMDELDDAGIDVGKLLISVWELKHSDIAQLRKRSGLSKGEFSGRYGIPYRTVQNWEAEGTEHRDPPEYLKMLIAYTMLEV